MAGSQQDGVRAQAARALAILDSMPDVEGQRIYPAYSASLDEALRPLRRTPAVEVLCGGANGRCQNRVAWWALDSGAAFVAATQMRAKPKKRNGGISELAEPTPRRNDGLAGWIELADSGTTSVRTVDVRSVGYPVRLKFVCRECDADYTTTNTKRLRAYLRGLQGVGPVVLARDL